MSERTVDHERMHPVEERPAWSESYYFNFVDPRTGVGMFTRMGFRPGDGWADALHALYLGGSRVAFTYGRRDIGRDLAQYDGDLRAGNLVITVLESFRRWRIDYAGPARDIADGAILLERSKLRPQGWYREARLEMSLEFECLTEPHFTYSNSDSAGAHGHFEQSGRVTGTIRLDDERFSVDGYGVRDKSWGPRDWGASQRENKAGASAAVAGPVFSTPDAPVPFVNWFSMNFGADVALGGSCFRHASGEIRGAGWMLRDGRSHGLTDVVITTTYRDASILHDTVRLVGRIDGGEAIEIDGRVINMCPTKVPMPGGATFINEGLAEFRWDGRTGHGIAEHWHAVAKA